MRFVETLWKVGRVAFVVFAADVVISRVIHWFKELKPDRYFCRLITFDDYSFSCNGDENCHARHCRLHNVNFLVETVDSARISLDMCVYMCTMEKLAVAVLNAHKRGVVVRILTDHDMAYNSGSRMYRFFDAGIKIKSKNSTNLMHHKFCIIDSPSRIAEIISESGSYSGLNTRSVFRSTFVKGKVIFGSMNWTQQAISGNWENVFVTTMLPIISQFQEEFNCLWKDFNDFMPY